MPWLDIPSFSGLGGRDSTSSFLLLEDALIHRLLLPAERGGPTLYSSALLSPTFSQACLASRNSHESLWPVAAPQGPWMPALARGCFLEPSQAARSPIFLLRQIKASPATTAGCEASNINQGRLPGVNTQPGSIQAVPGYLLCLQLVTLLPSSSCFSVICAQAFLEVLPQATLTPQKKART